MPVILVPYHLDEHLPDLDIPLPPGVDASTVAGALPDGPGTDVWSRLGALYEPVAGKVAEVVRHGAVPVLASGDCMVALAGLAGLERAGVDASVVWFDAHGDVQSLETTESGYVGGIPLRIAVGYRPELLSRRLGLSTLAEERVLLVDARDLDRAEAEYLAGSAIRRCGVEHVTAATVPDGPLFLHVDLDVVDGAELPGLRYPAPGGPNRAAVMSAARRVLATGRVAVLSIGCTCHPGPGGRARAELLAALVTSVPGGARR